MGEQLIPATRRHFLAGMVAAPAAIMTTSALAAQQASAAESSDTLQVHFRKQQVGNVEVFYREAGPKDGPVILLLHGFPTSSHMFRNLIPELADRFRVIAPDLPGFGLTVAPPRGEFEYSFDSIAKVIDGFIHALGLKKFAVYVFDYGAPTGFRIALWNPEKITAIITQNGNAYTEGLSKDWAPWQAYWQNPTPENREICRAALTDDAIRTQYEHGAPLDRIPPDGFLLDTFFMHRPGADEIQLDLILSYRTNVALYPDFHAYFKAHKPPLLAVWGKNDPFFLPPGAEAFKRDIPNAQVEFLDTGHFAAETHYREIAGSMRKFLKRIG